MSAGEEPSVPGSAARQSFQDLNQEPDENVGIRESLELVRKDIDGSDPLLRGCVEVLNKKAGLAGPSTTEDYLVLGGTEAGEVLANIDIDGSHILADTEAILDESD